MVDKPTDQDDSSSSSDWGADWEAAFQAEEDAMFSFDEGEYEELFKQAPNLPSEATLSEGESPESEAQAKEKPSKSLSNLLLAPAHALFDQITALYKSPQFIIRMLAYAVPVLLCLAFVITLFTPSPAPKTEIKPQVAVPDVPGAFDILEKAALRAKSQTEKKDQQVAPEILTQLAPGEKVRKKWSFSSFLIPASTEDDSTKLSFIVIELTLVTLLDADEPLPEDKKPYIRDVIYQFYANRPLYELRRYSLARGEMKRKLQAWVQKQWPEFPVESIIFDKYQVT